MVKGIGLLKAAEKYRISQDFILTYSQIYLEIKRQSKSQEDFNKKMSKIRESLLKSKLI